MLMLIIISGQEPLTPEDIAEVIVFAAGRRENVVLADSLIFPSHQVPVLPPLSALFSADQARPLLHKCIRSHDWQMLRRRLQPCTRFHPCSDGQYLTDIKGHCNVNRQIH